VIILVNGSFGVGKTTVSRLLQKRLPHSTILDPEPLGVVFLRLARLWPGMADIDDFQDLRAWRAVSVRAIGVVRRLRPIVIVPMAFSNVSYLRQFLSSLAARDGETVHFCLTAPLAVVRERLVTREVRQGPTAWQLRRSAECCSAHRGPEFAEQIATEGRSAQQVADEIVSRLRARESVALPTQSGVDSRRN
jgi:hypothetical protein